MDLQEVGWGRHGLASFDVGKVQLEGSCECGNEPLGCV